MLDKTLIQDLANQAIDSLQKEDVFLVEVKVSKNNIVEVVIDGDDGVNVDDCIGISRFIEQHLDRDKEDFELTVMSFGLEEYFVMPRQFRKNTGRDVEVVDKEGEKFTGVMSDVNEKFVTLTTKKDKEGRRIPFDEIDKAKVLINFSKKK